MTQQRQSTRPRRRPAGLALAILVLIVLPTVAAQEPESTAKNEPAEVNELIRGRVVALLPVLEKRFGAKIDDEMGPLYGLVTDDGRIYPILRQERGRAFYLDERLRNQLMDLYVRRFEGSPFVQVLLVYHIQDGRRYAVDYWCDICSISMYWPQPCECCQGPIRLRELPVTSLPKFIDVPKHTANADERSESTSPQHEAQN